MIVIIEGLDCCGKSTISKKIAEQLNYEYIHESYTDDIKEKESRIVKLLERLISGENYIYDRSTLIDDFVYDFLNETPSTLVYHLEYIRFLLSKCLIFHLEIDERIRLERFKNRGDEYINNDDIKRIRKNYNQIYSILNNVNHIVLSGDLDKDNDLLAKEIEYYDKGITHCLK